MSINDKQGLISLGEPEYLFPHAKYLSISYLEPEADGNLSDNW